MFSLSIPLLSYILLAAAVVGVIIARVYGMRPYIRAAGFQNPEMPADPGSCPKASVIVHARGGDGEAVMSAVESIKRQDYPDFEVIVVCDASLAQANYISDELSALYSDVYVTFLQPGSHNLSRRKLATTIGVKAAKGDVIVTTVANIRIPSDKWLSSIMAPFCGEAGRHTDVSLGLSCMDFGELTGALKWYRQFDSVLSNALWIGYAAAGHPYRGDGYNLAFRKSVFFAHKGYAKTINLHYGDDDLFISEIANGANTKVVLDSDSIVVTCWGESANRVWSLRKARYAFTSRWLERAPFTRASVMKCLQWIIPACAVVGAVAGLPGLVPAMAALTTLLYFWGMEIYHYRRLAPRMNAVRLWWAVVPFWFWKLIGDFLFNCDHRGSRKKNFTWQRSRKI